MRGLLCLLTASFVTAFAVRAGEEKVPLDKVPAAIRDAVAKRFPKAKIKGAAKEQDDAKKWVYEITLKQDKLNIDVTVTPEGAITLIEQELTFKDLPTAVAATFEARYPKATYKIVESVTRVKDGKETLEYYEALLTAADKKAYEVEVLPDGKFKAATEKKPGDKD
ncbi:MAG: PepSY-like domain-containing protein [Gemmataceae bacterium]